MFSPNIEPSSLFFSRNSNMNADCAPLFKTWVGDDGIIRVQRPTQLKKPREEGAVER
jgi:hypothetical protein